MNEEWRPVVGYEGLYEVSNRGRVKKSCGTILVCEARSKKGYLRVNISKNKRWSVQFVHRLVANAFLGNPNHRNQVNHKDGCKTNNDVSNLEWVTNSENQRHRIRVLGQRNPHGERNGKTFLRASDVIDMRRRRSNGETVRSLAREYGVSESNLSLESFAGKGGFTHECFSRAGRLLATEALCRAGRFDRERCWAAFGRDPIAAIEVDWATGMFASDPVISDMATVVLGRF